MLPVCEEKKGGENFLRCLSISLRNLGCHNLTAKYENALWSNLFESPHNSFLCKIYLLYLSTVFG
jgi:hypothetical protein